MCTPTTLLYLSKARSHISTAYVLIYVFVVWQKRGGSVVVLATLSTSTVLLFHPESKCGVCFVMLT